ncbi:MAG: hypothetical protein SAK29_41100 [Scytonema sp. PMC 1069.18]|nr:hypothetical protein [Scytonema sp. PMC 1069.18]MEC4888375.1 hypothetical protein [Scytonema sp. PMC 1070.18]
MRSQRYYEHYLIFFNAFGYALTCSRTGDRTAFLAAVAILSQSESSNNTLNKSPSSPPY